jgi:L-lactate dehydrogenase (cytochrome)
MPTLSDVERAAKRRIPDFAFAFVYGGTGDDLGVARNRAALDAVEIVPRYGAPAPVQTEVTLFGQRYASPIGIAPTGIDGLVWPGATRALAKTAAKASIPYIAGMLATASIEEVARICPASAWLQLYGFPRDNQALTFDVIRRAEAAGVHAIVPTLDAPARSKRPWDLRNGLVVPFRPGLRTLLQILSSPSWAAAVLRSGVPTFPNIAPYVKPKPSWGGTTGHAQEFLLGTFTWDEIKRMRDAWPRALVVKGVLHPEDAERAIAVGVDGVVVSNHGGRQSDAAPAAIDVLPAIKAAVGTRATVLFDSGIRSGLDAARALALGADAVFCGRAFLLGLAALGDSGGDYIAAMLTDELRVAMAQHGAHSIAELRAAAIRHPGAWTFAGAPPAA